MQNALSKKFMEKILKVMKLAQNQITEILATYQYKDNLTHEENMDQLIGKLEASVFQKNILDNFRQYLKISYNIPIQVNFKPLRFQQLVLIMDDWLLHDGEKSGSFIERGNTSINYRNDLFRRVCFEERQTIDEFFKINSKKKGIDQIKGFDLYQLICMVLSDYYLYEKKEDTEIFFDKENSFNAFLELVKKYEKDDKRLNFLHKNNATEIDRQFIQRFEFQKFLQYWQSVNPELILRDSIRQNLQSVQTQTHSILTHSIAIQTSRSRTSSLRNIINNALHQINTLFEKQSNGKVLKQMERIFDFLKVQKIKLLQLEDSGTGTDQQSYKKSREKTKSKNKFQYEEQKKTARDHKQKVTNKNIQSRNGPTKFNPLTPSPSKKIKYQIPKQQSQPKFNQTSPCEFIRCSPMTQKIHQYEDTKNNFFYQKISASNPKQVLYLIFTHYSQDSQFLDINQLNHFFYEFGLINFGQTHIIMNLMQHHLISNADHISFRNFEIILTELMKQDLSITWTIVEEFAKAKGLFKRGLLQKKHPPHLLFQIAKNVFDKNLIKQVKPENIRHPNNIRKFNINSYPYGQPNQQPMYVYEQEQIPLYKMKIPANLHRNYEQVIPVYHNQSQIQIQTKKRRHGVPSDLSSHRQRKDTPQDDIYEVDRSINYGKELKKRDEQNLLFTLNGKVDPKRSKINIQLGREKMWTQYHKQSSQDSLL